MGPAFTALVAALLLASPLRAGGAGLRDAPVAADALQFLDGEAWTISSADGVISAGGVVPGDLITDLQRAGVVSDPLYEENFLRPVWDAQNFSYSATFSVAPAVAAQASQTLVFDGIKMVADISLNGVPLGFVDNAFLRFMYDVTPLLRLDAPNTLLVTFTTSNDTRNKPGRYSACSGGWQVLRTGTLSSQPLLLTHSTD
jgi:beta-galactosidase/beta-glucuronidase